MVPDIRPDETPVEPAAAAGTPFLRCEPSSSQDGAPEASDLASSASDLVSQYITNTSRPQSAAGAAPAPPDVSQHAVFKRRLWPDAPQAAPPHPPALRPQLSGAQQALPALAQNEAARRIQRAWRLHNGLMKRSFCHFGGEALRLVQRFISGAGFEERAASRAHLILHFDINKTILIADAAKGAGQADMINVLLSECAWGRMTVGPAWVPVGRLATDRPANDPQLMSYRNFLDSFLYPFVEGSDAAALAENSRRKRLCHELQRRFTAPGQPGAMFVGVFAALEQRMSQPDGETAPFFGSGERRLLPSFFELLLHLHKTGRTFTIVFRTFGTDVRDVVEEMNMFATGAHPSYPGVALAGQNATDLRLSIPHSTGAFLRTGQGPDDTVLALGVDEAVLEAKQMTREMLEAATTRSGGVLVHGFANIHRVFTACAAPGAQLGTAIKGGQKASESRARGAEWVLRHRAAKNCAFAVRDYYHYWKQRNERPKAGKLMLCDPDDTSVISMFFDDNIGHSSAHIADVRNVRDSEPIPFSQARNALLMRAEPVNAILDPMYFIRAVAEAELTILRRAERRTIQRPSMSLDLQRSGFIFKGHAFKGLHHHAASGVARVSLRAKQRWAWALRRILIMLRLTRVLQA